MTAQEISEQFEVRWSGGPLLPDYCGNSTLTLAVQQKRQKSPINPFIVRKRQRPTTDRERKARIQENAMKRMVGLLRNGGHA